MSPPSSAIPTRPIVLALGSAALLLLAFPNFNQPWCAWGALMPWLLLLQRARRPRVAFGWSYLIGLLFFLGSMWWLVHVTVLGWLVLCAYLALYFGIFGWCVCRFTIHDSRFTLVMPPALWVALEYGRSHLLTGLGWNLLAYSQTPYRALIQIADVTGAWGVSFLIVLVNVAIAEMAHDILSSWQQATRNKRQHRVRQARIGYRAASLAALTVLVTFGYGMWRLSRLPSGPMLRVAVVQGNIPQEEKWDDAYQARIQGRYATLTRAAAASQPDLIVWPETSAPGYLTIDEPVTQWVIAVAKEAHAPLLAGAPVPTLVGSSVELRNSAVLVEADGTIRQRHDKLHLVPFGEFIPFERVAPWLRNVLPPIGDFTPGHSYTVFRQDRERHGARGTGRGANFPAPPVSRPPPPFSVLICFEDLFPEMARRFVQQGAQLLLVITNDAWFGPTAAAYQHAQASTFRAIELRVPIARSANTGWSGCIDPAGRWVGSVRDPSGRELFVDGTHTCEVPLGNTQTVYRRFGDWFALLCLGLSLLTYLSYNKGLQRKGA